MVWTSLDCPRCEARHQFVLGPDEQQHLRQCPDCDQWFIAHGDTDSGHGYRTDALDDPPTCPVDSCDEVVPSERLPSHIVETHDGSIT